MGQAPETDVTPALTPVQLGKAPKVRPMPDGLPAPRRAPLDGRWVDSESGQHRTGTYLPMPLDTEVMRRLRILDHYPDICQRYLDERAATHHQEMQGQAAILESRCLAERIDQAVEDDPRKTLPVWLVGVIVAGSSIVSLLGGYGIRSLTH